MGCAAFARRGAADHFGAIGNRLLGMERAILAGETLADHAGVLIDEDAHDRSSRLVRTRLPRSTATTPSSQPAATGPKKSTEGTRISKLKPYGSGGVSAKIKGKIRNATVTTNVRIQNGFPSESLLRSQTLDATAINT